MTLKPDPLQLNLESELDRGYEDVRLAAIRGIQDRAAETWTDHNASDPGITLLESVAYTIADLHYRIANREFDRDEMAAPLWESAPSSFGLGQGTESARKLALAEMLATTATDPDHELVAHQLTTLIGNQNSLPGAIAAVTDADVAGAHLSREEAALAVALIRSPLRQRLAQDLAHLVAGAFSAADGVPEAALAALRRRPEMDEAWDSEILALVERERHRRLLEAVEEMRPQISAAATTADVDAVEAELTAAGLSPAEVTAALGLHPCPPGLEPESWEDPVGDTVSWPPHPLQSLTCEPVTAADYASRARLHPEVGRAWVVRGRLATGLDWRGQASPGASNHPGQLTILAERTAGDPSEPAFLRDVLRTAVGGHEGSAEVDRPFPDFRDPIDAPRRLMCDEVGAAGVTPCRIVVKATLFVDVASPRAAAGEPNLVLARAKTRIEEWFAAGREESRVASAAVTCPNGIEGPWPYPAQPSNGWMPGEAIPLSELAAVLANDAAVLGVDDVQVRLADATDWYPGPGDVSPFLFPIDAHCVPVLADEQCITESLEFGETC